MKLNDLVKSISSKKGRVRLIDENGKVIDEHQTDGISIDFIDARWLVKTGELKSPHHSID
ncbi:hypothetical protein OAM55_00455 [Flavobacteriaceae bacterium]|nr:hypothetical protein [Flavobacteriaceae bacterium]